MSYWYYERGEGDAEPKPLTVRHLMKEGPVCVGPKTLVRDAGRVMHENRIHHLPVVNEQNQVVGILSMRDILQNILHGHTLNKEEQYHASLDEMLPVEEIMSREVFTLGAEALVSEVAGLFLKRHIHCVPVVDGHNQLEGIVTETDLIALLKHMVD